MSTAESAKQRFLCGPSKICFMSFNFMTALFGVDDWLKLVYRHIGFLFKKLFWPGVVTIALGTLDSGQPPEKSLNTSLKLLHDGFNKM